MSPDLSTPSYWVASLASISPTNSAWPISFRYLTKAETEPFKLDLPIPEEKALETIACKYSWPITFVCSAKAATRLFTNIFCLPSDSVKNIPSARLKPLCCFSNSSNLSSESTISTSICFLLNQKPFFCSCISSLALSVLLITCSVSIS